MFREDKTTQMAATFLKLGGRRMHYVKLLKLLYLADRKMLTTRGKLITYDRWVSLDNGPVLSLTYDLGKEDAKPSYWKNSIAKENRDAVLCEDPGTEDLSQAEDKIIEETFAEFGHLGPWQLVDLLHTYTEWEDPHGKSTKIHYQTVMRSAGFSEEDIEATMDNIGAQDALERVLAMV